jgi:hypothetical protein
LFFIVALSVAVYYTTATSTEATEGDIDCYIDHLKKHKILNSAFPKYSNESRDSGLFSEELYCAMTIVVFKEKILNRLRDFSKQEKKCVEDEYNTNEYGLTTMLLTVYERKNLIPEAERTQKFLETKKETEKIRQKFLVACLTERTFGDLFDSEISSVGRDEKEDENYCARKFVVEHNLIDTAVYNVMLNPKNINIDNVDCKKITKKWIKKEEKRAIKDFEEDTRECVLVKDRETGNAHKHLRLKVLRELNITDEQKQIERVNFINHMKEFYKKVITCMP